MGVVYKAWQPALEPARPPSSFSQPSSPRAGISSSASSAKGPHAVAPASRHPRSADHDFGQTAG